VCQNTYRPEPTLKAAADWQSNVNRAAGRVPGFVSGFERLSGARLIHVTVPLQASAVAAALACMAVAGLGGPRRLQAVQVIVRGAPSSNGDAKGRRRYPGRQREPPLRACRGIRRAAYGVTTRRSLIDLRLCDGRQTRRERRVWRNSCPNMCRRGQQPTRHVDIVDAAGRIARHQTPEIGARRTLSR